MKTCVLLFTSLFSLSILMMVSCVGFNTDPENMNRVEGEYFQDTGFVYHFSDTCYFSQECHSSLEIPQYKDKAELSCLIRADEGRKYPWFYCIYIALPDDYYRIEEGRLNLASRCPVTVKFLRLRGCLIFPMGEYEGVAKFTEVDIPCSTTEDGTVSQGAMRVKLLLDGRELYLTFNNIAQGSVFRFI